MSIDRRTRPLLAPAGNAAALVGTLLAIYMVTQFLRNSVAVIAPDLAATIGLTAADLGLLSSIFFLVFALAQLPVGVALDRFGARRVLLVCSATIILGCLGFAAGDSSAALIGARALMGMGCSSAFMASLAIYARRFPPDRFATLTGLQYGIGSIGSLFATVPLAWSAAAIGWRASFVAVGALVLLAALLIAVVVREEAESPLHERGGLAAALRGIAAVMRTPSVVPLFVMNLTCYSSFALFVGLWGGPYLSHVYGYGLHDRGELLLIPAVAQIGGAFLWGPVDRLFGGYKTPVLIGAGATLAALAIIGVFGVLPLPLLIVWMVLFGGVSAYTVLVIAHGKALLAPNHIGRGLTLFNMATIGGVFIAQAVSGLVIDLFPAVAGRYPLNAYRAVFLLQAIFIAVAMAIYTAARDPRRADAAGYAKMHEGIPRRN